MMKAYKVFDKYDYDGYATVVFAESANKARYLALSTYACEDSEYKDISAHREPTLDKYYKEGKKEMEWDNPKDKLAMVKAGWHCLYYECDDENCPAKKWCGKFDI